MGLEQFYRDQFLFDLINMFKWIFGAGFLIWFALYLATYYFENRD